MNNNSSTVAQAVLSNINDQTFISGAHRLLAKAAIVSHKKLNGSLNGNQTQEQGLTLAHILSRTGDEEVDSVYNFIGLSLVLLILLWLTFLIWKNSLFSRFGAYIPIDRNLDVQQINKRKVFMSTKNYQVFKQTFMPLVSELKMDYWCTHTGVDGYLYLLFQRRFLRLTIYMGCISVVAQYVAYLNDKDYAFHFMGE